TAGTTLTGLRFPANTNTVPSSDSPTRYQLISPKLGLLLVLEPWDYVNASNRLIGNPSLAFGFDFFQFSSGQAEVSTLLGPQFQIPLLRDETGQLGAAFGMGLFWENDLRGGNYFTTRFNLNIGSLFS